MSLKQKKTLSPSVSHPSPTAAASFCHRLRMKEMESEGVASDQINGGSLMRFAKQRRSRGSGLRSRLSNLGVTDTIDPKSPLCPLHSRDSSIPFILPAVLLPSHARGRPCIPDGRHSLTSRPHSSCVPSCRTKTHNPPSLPPPFILCAHDLNRWSPFDSRTLPASESLSLRVLLPPTTPVFVLSSPRLVSLFASEV